MARSGFTTSDYLSVASTLLGDEPIDMLAYGRSTSAANNQKAIVLGDGGGPSGFWGLAWRGDVASDPIRAEKNNDGGSGLVSAASSAGYSTNVWHVGWASFISNTSRAAGIDGGNKGTNTTSRTNPTPNFMSIGILKHSGAAAPFEGDLAECYLLDYNLSDEQHAARGKGYSALWDVPVKNVRGWYPLLRDDNNRMAGGYPDLTPTGSPTFSSHPPKVIHPRIGALITV